MFFCSKYCFDSVVYFKIFPKNLFFPFWNLLFLFCYIENRVLYFRLVKPSIQPPPNIKKWEIRMSPLFYLVSTLKPLVLLFVFAYGKNQDFSNLKATISYSVSINIFKTFTWWTSYKSFVLIRNIFTFINNRLPPMFRFVSHTVNEFYCPSLQYLL